MLLDHAQIQKRLEVVGRHISEDYAGKNPLVVGVLTGAIMVVADLVRHITIPCELDFLAASSCVFAILWRRVWLCGYDVVCVAQDCGVEWFSFYVRVREASLRVWGWGSA